MVGVWVDYAIIFVFFKDHPYPSVSCGKEATMMESDEVLNEAADGHGATEARLYKPVQGLERVVPKAELSLAACVGWLDGRVHNQLHSSSCQL